MKYLIFLLPSFAMATMQDYTDAGTMLSDSIVFNNPACVITKAQGRTQDLPILEPNTNPNASDYFELVIETQIGYQPVISASQVNITGVNNLNADEISLFQLNPNGSETVVSSSPMALESTNAFNTDFDAKLFFKAKQTKDKYPPTLITAETTVSIECDSI